MARKNQHFEAVAQQDSVSFGTRMLGLFGAAALSFGFYVSNLPDKNPQDSTVRTKPTHTNVMKTPAVKPPATQSAVPARESGVSPFAEGMIITERPVVKETKPYETPVEKKITTHTAPVSYGAMPKLVEKYKDGSEVYTVGTKKVRLSPDVADAFRRAEENTKLPRELMIATCTRESNCKPEAVNIDTKACGLFQFMPALTLPRVTYTNYAHGRELVKESVRKYDKKGRAILDHHPRNEIAQAKLARLCLNPYFNTNMWAADKLPEIKYYELWLEREATIGEMVIVNNLGSNGTKRFVRQVWEDVKSGHDTLAIDFFGKLTGAQNPSFIRYPDGRKKTVRQAYNDIMNEFGGWKPLSQLTPSQEL